MIPPSRYFTPEQATRMLPLVRCIVRDINEKGTQLRELADQDLAQSDLFRKTFGEIGELMEELESLGCYYKDWGFSIGLVDFPAIIRGHEVYLCWCGDEDSVSHYHTRDNGYENRQPIPQDCFSRESILI